MEDLTEAYANAAHIPGAELFPPRWRALAADHGVTIGDRVILNPGVSLGADGFSFVTPEKSGVEEIRQSLGERAEIRQQHWTRIHSLGGVEIGDDVEIGANSTVDRGTIRATRIGRGTKIDNLVQVGHNCLVGEDCLLCGLVGIAGSARIGNRVVLGGQVGVSDNIFVGDDVIAGGATKIFTNAPAGRVLLGSPAVKMEAHVEAQTAMGNRVRATAPKRSSVQGKTPPISMSATSVVVTSIMPATRPG